MLLFVQRRSHVSERPRMILTLACSDTPRTRRLLDGSIGIEGCDLKTNSFPPEEMFRRAFEDAEFDISELSFATSMLHIDRGTCPYVGIPVFPSRAFRHAAIYVRSDCSITSPEDLRGRNIGVRNYLNTAALVVRGLFSDVYGIAAEDINWWIGDVDQVERDTIPIPRLLRPANIQAAQGRTLSAMLMDGAIDAIVHYHPPRGFGDADAPIRRLFADTAAAERDYYRSTGIFPIMHMVGIRRDVYERDPSLAVRVYDAFNAAGDAAVAPKPPLPDTSGIDITAPEFWRNGVGINRTALECLIRYGFEQGLTSRPLTMGDLFVPTLLAT